MKNNILVSIVIPVFNVRPYLAEALDSVVHQSYENIEIIIIDDGSADGSEAICDDYLRKDDRVHVVHQENKGISNARNAGLSLANGDAVAFLDPDDAYHPDFIASMTEIMIRENADIVTCQYTAHVTTGRMEATGRGKPQPMAKKGQYDRIAALRALADGLLDVSVCNKVFRRELWKTIRFPDGHVYEDVDTTYRVFDVCETVYVLNRPLYLRRKRPGSITDTRTLKNLYDRNLAYSHFDSYVEANTPGVFTIEQTMKRRQASLNILFRVYLRYSSKTLRSMYMTEDDLQKCIKEEVQKIGLKNCSLRSRAAYRMLCSCPSLLRMIYPIYRHVKLFVRIKPPVDPAV